MFWTSILIFGLCRLPTPTLAQFVYAYDAESNGPPQSDLFNPSFFRYVPPSGVQTDTGNNYVGRATPTSGRVRGSPPVSSSSNLPVAGSRSFATASEYFHPTNAGNSVSQPEYQPRQPGPVPHRTYEVSRAYQPPPPPPQPQYEVAQAAPQTYQLIPHDQFEQSRQQLYADQPSHNNPLQYSAIVPQTHHNTRNFPEPFSSYHNFRPVSTPEIIHRPAQTYQAQPNVYTSFQDQNSGPAQDSFFRSVGQSIYRPAPQASPQPVYQPFQPYQYNYRHPYADSQFEELQPESPPQQEYQPPEDNQIQEQPKPAPTNPPQRQRTRTRSRSKPLVSAYEPAPTSRPQRQYTPPREEYVAPTPRPQRPHTPSREQYVAPTPRPQTQYTPRREEYVAPRPQRRPDTVTEAPPRRGTTHRPATISVAQLPSDVDKDGIPGEGGVDYPVLSTIPKTSFSCSRQPINGYYADLETACQVVHSCQAGGIQHSYLCPNGTIFNQEMFSCQWWYRVDCAQASQYYALNDKLYKTTEAPRRRAPPPPPQRTPTAAPFVEESPRQPARRPYRPSVEQPRPRPVVEQPRPRPVVEQPRPRPVVERPRPRPVVEEPVEQIVRRPAEPAREEPPTERTRNQRRRERQQRARAQKIEAELRNTNQG